MPRKERWMMPVVPMTRVGFRPKRFGGGGGGFKKKW
jgi:hypothetical protein